MKRLKYLYAIKDPRTDETVYVGQTFHPQQRMKEHIRGKLDVDHWIREMHAKGLEPIMEIIERKRVGFNRRERQLIDAAKRQASFFLNRKIPVNI